VAATTPGGALIVVAAKDNSTFYWEATWRHASRAMKRRLGVAWVRPRSLPADIKGWQGRYEKRPGNPTGGELTPQQAMLAMRDLIASHASTAPVRGAPRTFRQAAQAWLDDPHARAHAWSPSTEADYRRMLAEPGGSPRPRGTTPEGRILATFGDQRVDKITAEDVRKFLRGLDDSLTARTVNKYKVVLGLVFADAAARGWRTGNPAAEAARRRQPMPSGLDMFSVEQVEAIAERAGGELGALIIVAAMAGLRRGELVALRWRDVRFEQPALHVERAVSAGELKRPKSGKGRVVPLADRPLEVLQQLAAREYWTDPDDLVFPRPDGRMRGPDAVSHAYVQARNAATWPPIPLADASGLPALRFHDLRHTFGTLLARAGVSGFDIQAWMGHSSYATTQRYLHHAPRAGDAARVTAAMTGG
jgi:integrase